MHTQESVTIRLYNQIDLYIETYIGLCDLGQVTYILLDPVSLYVKWN